ncbi:MAG: Acanthocystis turfacea chlorella virus 1 [Pseudomonadota bacterium]|jgi:hypothetical protein
MITDVEHIQKAIEKSKNNQSNLPPAILQMVGMSTNKTRHLFNNLANTESKINYLEIGTYRGATASSVLYNNLVNAIIIDDFSQFQDLNLQNAKSPVPEDFSRNVALTLNFSNTNPTAKFYNKDCFSIDKKEIFNEKIDFYFYDGEHSYESQYKAYEYYNDILENKFLTVIDDFNDEVNVKGATLDAFKKLNYEILFHEELPAGKNSNSFDEEAYWNGLGIFLIQKK